MNNSKNPYSWEKDGEYYCLLPGRGVKRIPNIELYKKIDWVDVYYRVFDNMIHDHLSEEDVRLWDITTILQVIGVRV